MIDFYYWPTPNGHKVTLMLEECGLVYTIHPVNIGAGDQHKPEFLKISPNNRMPAIVDHAPEDRGPPLSVFESGAILQYLAEKTRRFAGTNLRERIRVSEWLFWQVGGLGPMAGQAGHFIRFAPEPVPYGIKRYTDETLRLLGVLERRLAVSTWLAGDDYSIADMASYPWALAACALTDAKDLPHLEAWVLRIQARPATIAAYARAADAAPPAA